MKLEDMLKQQQKRGFMQKKIKAEMQSYDDYAKDDLSPRPYNTPNVSDFKKDVKNNEPVTEIRDTKSNEPVTEIKDTKSNESVTEIKDTKSNEPVTEIRDTKSNEPVTEIRDTKNNIGLSFNIGRPTKGKYYSYYDLAGNAKKLVDEIAHQCMLVGDLTTPNIGKASFSKNTGVKLGAIKTTILRLREKSVIVSYEASKGRNSSWKFTLSAEVYQQYITSKRAG